MEIDRSRKAGRSSRWGIILSLAAAWLLYIDAVSATSYVYDANGRLRAATNSTGTSSQYDYDSLGNLLRVVSVPAGQLAIFAFTPGRGPVGTTVTIFGSGFSGTPSKNEVKFASSFPSGVSANVLTATTSKLTVTVPSGAVTGPILISVVGATAASADSFVVASSDQAEPTISGFSPIAAKSGTAITVTGTNHVPVAGATTVRLNSQTIATSNITSQINTQTVFNLPTGIGSGKISITTPYGSATSMNDLIVVPTTSTPAIDPANVTSSIRLTPMSPGPGFGGAGTLTMAAGKVGVFLFDGNPGDWLTLQATSVSTTASSIAYLLYDPRGAQVASGSISTASPSFHLPQLTSTGTYSLFTVPGAVAGSITAYLEINDVLTPDASSLSATTSTATQSRRLIIPGTIGQKLGMGLVVNSGSGTPLSATVYKPDGTSLAVASGCTVGTGCSLDLWASNQALTGLPATGIYWTIVKPPTGGTMNATTTLTSDATTTLTVNTPYTLNLPRAGQNGRLTFTTSAMQTLALSVAGLTTTPSGQRVTLTVYNASGTQVASANTTVSSLLVNLPSLPAGTYTVLIGAQYAATATMQVTLTSGSVLTIGGTPTTVTTTIADQYAYLTFAGTAGQTLGMGVALNSGSSTPLSITIYKPDGASLASVSSCAASTGCSLDLWASNGVLAGLPVSGTYSVVVKPPAGGTINFTTTLTSDATTTLTVNTPYTLNLPRAGQNGRLTFTTSAMQTLALSVAGLTTTPSGQRVTLTVYNASGTQVASANTTVSSLLVNLPSLPAGTYTVLIGAQYAATATMQVTLTSGSVLTIGGTPTTTTTTIADQYAYLTFAGTTGQTLGMGVALNSGSSTPLNITIYKPDGASLASASSCAASTGCSLDLWASNGVLAGLPVSGTYSVVVKPPASGTMNFTTTLTNDATTTLTVNTPYTLNLPRAGQNGRLTFTTSTTQNISLEITGLSTTPANQRVYMTVYKADGTQVSGGSTWTTTDHVTLNLPSLPAGTYTVLIGAQYAATATMQVTQSGS